MKSSHPDIIDDNSSRPSMQLTHRMNVSQDNPNVIVQGPFYRVSSDMGRIPLADYLEHGYETRREFYEAVTALINRWRSREGECIEERCFHGKEGEAIDQRHRVLHLRFHDTPGGRPDEAWLPLYLLEPISTPEYARWHNTTPEEQVIDEIDSALWDDE